MNAAFLRSGTAHILEASKQAHQSGLSSNLATGLQVQMYLGAAQASAGLARDVVEVVQMAREGMREAAAVTSALGMGVSIETRLLRTLGTTLDVVGVCGVGGHGGRGHLQPAEREDRPATRGGRCAVGVDSTSLAITAGAIVAEWRGRRGLGGAGLAARCRWRASASASWDWWRRS